MTLPLRRSFLLLLLVVPALAQAQDRCAALLDALPLRPQERPATVEAPDGGTCRFGPMRFSLGGPAGYEVASLTVRGAIPAPGGPATATRLEARGVALSVRSGDAATDWMLRQQAQPFDIVLDLAQDPVAGRADLRELSLDGPALGRVEASATVEGVGVPRDAADALRRSDTAGLRALRLRLDSPRFVVTYVLPAMIRLIPSDDPGGAVERAKAEAARAIRERLPASGASAATVEALAGFVADFPHPRHPLEVRLTVPGEPLRLSDLPAGPSGEQVASVLRRLHVEATYGGAFR